MTSAAHSPSAPAMSNVANANASELPIASAGRHEQARPPRLLDERLVRRRASSRPRPRTTAPRAPAAAAPAAAPARPEIAPTAARSRRVTGGRSTSAAGRSRCSTASRSCARACASSSTNTPDELEHGQRRSGLQVQQDRGLAVDLHLQRRLPGRAQQQHDAERGEREQEHDRGGGQDRRPEERPGRLAERSPGRGAQHPCRLLRAWVEMRPEPAHQPDDDRDVVEDGGEDDRRDRRAVQAELRAHPGPGRPPAAR